uniref:Dipeptidyl peptidase 1 n=1 Tax=Trichuris muris TaxID=70415 RepID=A0A5S6R2I5_TRIMR
MTTTFLSLIFFLLFVVRHATCDTPAECYFEDIAGTWLIYESETVSQRTNCSAVTNTDKFDQAGLLQLIYPNVAIDKINNRVYFAFSKWKEVGRRSVVSICDEILPGWLHDVHGHHWACFTGKKLISLKPNRIETNQQVDIPTKDKLKSQFINNKAFIDAINRIQSSWIASECKEWETATYEDMVRKAGGRRAFKKDLPSPPPSSAETRRLAAALPEQWDWRNVSGVNYVSEVRDQGYCGSCYIFASVAILESRYRILTRNEQKPILSPQDVLNCSPYAQGCNGGFPFLIAGKHAEDFGFVDEKEPCKRYYATNYQYVGGYYGASNEDLIKLAVYHNGPVAVGIQVYADFYHYKSGIYRHLTNLVNFTAEPYGWNPFVEVNHAVTVVGYGVQKETGTKYWIVKNSWGRHWGENGYVKILRGTNECGIESLALESTPIIHSVKP